MSRLGIATELHKPARRNYRRRKVVTRGLNELFQADLVEMIPYARSNKGYKYMLTVIDVYSKYAWAIPVKTKKSRDVALAMAKVFLSGRIPRHLHTDQGKEFYNTEFRALMNKHGINHYSTFSNVKASVVERFNRTLKTKMWTKFTLNGNYKWLILLPRLLREYNTSVHRSIGMKPADVVDDSLLRTKYADVNAKGGDERKLRAKVGDTVRISRQKGVFEKGFTSNWSPELFRVAHVRETVPRTYYLQDMDGKDIRGGFYAEEILPTRYPDTYLVERVLKRKKDRLYVKWLGFPARFNSWVPVEDLTT